MFTFRKYYATGCRSEAFIKESYRIANSPKSMGITGLCWLLNVLYSGRLIGFLFQICSTLQGTSSGIQGASGDLHVSSLLSVSFLPLLKLGTEVKGSQVRSRGFRSNTGHPPTPLRRAALWLRTKCCSLHYWTLTYFIADFFEASHTFDAHSVV